MKRVFFFAYGIVAYLLTLAVFAYLAGFIGGFLVPTPLDGALIGSFWSALAIDIGLIALFGLQHSVMARPEFKAWFTKVVPESIERSTYCILSVVALAALFFMWQPLGGTIWKVESEVGFYALYALYALGWAIVLSVSFLINHFDLFGLRQVWLQLIGRPYTALKFTTPGPYKFVRHPLYIGWLTVLWATPTMTLSHAVLALGVTSYILLAIPFEEQDLEDCLGADYAQYRDTVPMLIPGTGHPKPRFEAQGTGV
jgi:protein-S-isoprenylcysteine O-methyltransferase Ste14